MRHLYVILTLIALFVATASCSGPRGLPGDQGIPGLQGPTGDVGAPGISPTVLLRPANASECPTGGVAIEVGTQTTPVCNGAVGVPGVNAPSVNLMQLCPGTPSYPSTFVEFGICIGSNLYAVYSANGGFLTSLPSGAYYSNAIGSTCNFTVTSGCSITW